MKAILIITLLLTLQTAFGDNVKLETMAEAGYNPIDVLVFDLNFTSIPGAWYTKMNANIVFLDTLFIGGMFDCTFAFTTNLSGMPYLMNYGFWAGIRIGGLEIGFRHFCYHPVLVSGRSYSRVSAGGYEEAYVKFSGDITIF